jgi:dihydropteroate synthase
MFKIPARDRIWEIHRPQVMGIMNATKDSFYDASRINDISWAIEKAGQFISQGASVIDIGGQSTRPGAELLSAQDEIQKVVPIIEAICAAFPEVLISIDTYHSSVAEAALKAGAHIVNDISCGSFDKGIFKIVADNNAGYIGMHITGTMQTMHEIPNRINVVDDIIAYFKQKQVELSKWGINNWVIDPGFGFGKTIQENFTLVKALSKLLGVSRKSSICKTLGVEAKDALNGTTAVNTVGLLNGASVLRVHDVKEAKQIVDLLPFLF